MYNLHFDGQINICRDIDEFKDALNKLRLYVGNLSYMASSTRTSITDAISNILEDIDTQNIEDIDDSDVNDFVVDIFYYDEYNDCYFIGYISDYIRAFDRNGNSLYLLVGLPDTPDVFTCSYDDEVYIEDDYSSIYTEDGYTVCESNLDYIYCDDDGRYYYHEENIPQPKYVDNYHSQSSYSQHLKDAKNTTFNIGFEAEKEDVSVKESIYIDDFKNMCSGWRKESDSSLDDDSGFELISPIFKMDADAIYKHIKENSTLSNHINADISRNCGGHMTISCDILSSDELFDSISGYIPIIFAMYYGRLSNGYCEPKTKQYTKDYRNRNAIHIKNSACIEFRVFSAIKNLNQLHFRLSLMQFILENSTPDFTTAKENIRGIYDSLFKYIYSPEQFNRMLNRSEVYATDYEYHHFNESVNV